MGITTDCCCKMNAYYHIHKQATNNDRLENTIGFTITYHIVIIQLEKVDESYDAIEINDIIHYVIIY